MPATTNHHPRSRVVVRRLNVAMDRPAGVMLGRMGIEALRAHAREQIACGRLQQRHPRRRGDVADGRFAVRYWTELLAYAEMLHAIYPEPAR